MKVKDDLGFKSEFPEAYPWGRVDSVMLSNISTTIVNWIEHDLRSVKRELVTGLRVALKIIAEHAVL